jgi:hypothetical protein
MSETGAGEHGNAAIRAVCAGLAVCNGLAVALFLVLAIVVPEFSVLSARGHFTELDRAGVINAGALDPGDRRYTFSSRESLDYRRTVPVYIASAPLAEQRFNAQVGLLVAGVNTIAFGALWWNLRKKRARLVSAGEP